jgi:cell division protein FtsQ
LPINKVDVSGNLHYLKKSSLRETVLSTLGERGFFRVNVKEIQSLLIAQPWVHKAVVRRVWKDTLLINIKEQVPVAHWGKNGFLNKDGEIFIPKKAVSISGLVRLTGPQGLEKVMLEHYRIIVNKLTGISVGVTEVILTDRGSWTIITSGEKQLIFGKQFLSQRLERFLLGYAENLSVRWESVKRIDLRYSNGFAVASDTLL